MKNKKKPYTSLTVSTETRELVGEAVKAYNERLKYSSATVDDFVSMVARAFLDTSLADDIIKASEPILQKAS